MFRIKLPSIQDHIRLKYFVDVDKILWALLLYTALFYNFHRYILGYAHSEFVKDNYTPTPFIWKLGKYLIVLFFITLISFRFKFKKSVPLNLVLFYSAITLILVINILNYVIFQSISTDEIEYVLFALFLAPLAFAKKADLNYVKEITLTVIDRFQYIIILSNWIVIFNYIYAARLPLHAYEGALLRFGSLWDDPNTLSIFSAFLLAFSLRKKQFIASFFHLINIILSVSFNGYLLLFFVTIYWAIKSKKNVLLFIITLSTTAFCLLIVYIINIDLVIQIIDAKRESINQHSDIGTLKFSLLPLSQPILMHETWLLSAFINYFPFSVVFLPLLLLLAFRFFLVDDFSLQKLFYMIFILSSLFLPFLYMFPINFIGILFAILYMKGIKF